MFAVTIRSLAPGRPGPPITPLGMKQGAAADVASSLTKRRRGILLEGVTALISSKSYQIQRRDTWQRLTLIIRVEVVKSSAQSKENDREEQA